MKGSLACWGGHKQVCTERSLQEGRSVVTVCIVTKQFWQDYEVKTRCSVLHPLVQAHTLYCSLKLVLGTLTASLLSSHYLDQDKQGHCLHATSGCLCLNAMLGCCTCNAVAGSSHWLSRCLETLIRKHEVLLFSHLEKTGVHFLAFAFAGQQTCKTTVLFRTLLLRCSFNKVGSACTL